MEEEQKDVVKGTGSVRRRNSDIWWKERRVCVEEEYRDVVKGTESVRKRNREMWWKERRVCGRGTERCSGRNGEMRRRNGEMWRNELGVYGERNGEYVKEVSMWCKEWRVCG